MWQHLGRWSLLSLALSWVVAVPSLPGCRAPQKSGMQKPEVTPSGAEPSSADEGFAPATDGSLRITGVVVENDHGCVRDLPCLLRVDVEGREVLVVYHEGESSDPCPNTAATKVGFEVQEGQRIAARGRYRQEGSTVIISTCPSEDYFIELL